MYGSLGDGENTSIQKFPGTSGGFEIAMAVYFSSTTSSLCERSLITN